MCPGTASRPGCAKGGRDPGGSASALSLSRHSDPDGPREDFPGARSRVLPTDTGGREDDRPWIALR